MVMDAIMDNDRIMDARLEGQYSKEGAKKAAALAYQCLSHNCKSRFKEAKLVSLSHVDLEFAVVTDVNKSSRKITLEGNWTHYSQGRVILNGASSWKSWIDHCIVVPINIPPLWLSVVTDTVVDSMVPNHSTLPHSQSPPYPEAHDFVHGFALNLLDFMYVKDVCWTEIQIVQVKSLTTNDNG